MIFYNVPVSNFGLKVRLALDVKGLTVDERLPPDGYGSVAYKAIVPSGTIPAIVDETLVLSESGVIVEWLEESFPDNPLLPESTSERAVIRWFDRLHDTRIEPYVRSMFRHMAPPSRDAAFVQSQFGMVSKRLALTEPRLAEYDFMSGAKAGLADLAYPGTLLLARKMSVATEQPFRMADVVQCYLERMLESDTFGPSLAAYSQVVDEWLEAKLTGR